VTELVAVSEINALHKKACHSADNAVECGKQLIEAKKAVGHGERLLWVEVNMEFGGSSARRYVAVYRQYGRCLRTVRNKVTLRMPADG
jgi:hypothetical protein